MWFWFVCLGFFLSYIVNRLEKQNIDIGSAVVLLFLGVRQAP